MEVSHLMRQVAAPELVVAAAAGSADGRPGTATASSTPHGSPGFGSVAGRRGSVAPHLLAGARPRNYF